MKKIILVLIGAMVMFSCNKLDTTRELPSGTSKANELPNDKVLEVSKEKETLLRKKPIPPNNPHSDPPSQPPPETSIKKVCFLLDFDGHNVSGTVWNTSGDFYCEPSGLNDLQRLSVLNRVKYDFSFNDSIDVTTDEARYNLYQQNKRRRCVITSTNFAGNVGGIAYIGSLLWNDDSPCFVFSGLLLNNEKFCSDASTHEIIHTGGGRHHSDWRFCVFYGEYWVGDDIMGNSYSADNPQLKTGTTPLCCECLEDSKQVMNNSVNQ